MGHGSDRNDCKQRNRELTTPSSSSLLSERMLLHNSSTSVAYLELTVVHRVVRHSSAATSAWRMEDCPPIWTSK